MPAFPPATVESLKHLPHLLAVEFPAAPVEHVAEVVAVAAEPLLDTARFYDYVPLLTHRRAREMLLAELETV